MIALNSSRLQKPIGNLWGSAMSITTPSETGKWIILYRQLVEGEQISKGDYVSFTGIYKGLHQVKLKTGEMVELPIIQASHHIYYGKNF